MRLPAACIHGNAVLHQVCKLCFQQGNTLGQRRGVTCGLRLHRLRLNIRAETDQRHFQLHAAVACPRHAVAALPDGIECIQHAACGIFLRELLQLVQLLRHTADQLRCLRRGFQQHHIAELLRDLIRKARHVLRLPVQPVDAGQRGSGILCGDGMEHGKDRLRSRDADCLFDRFVPDRIGNSGTLIQQAQRIAQTAVREHRNAVRGGIGHGEGLVRGDILDAGGNVLGQNAAEIKPLTA